MGKRQVEELARRAAADAEAFCTARRPGPAPDEALLVMTFDGKGIVMRPGALREATARKAASARRKLATRLSPGEKHGRKRMAIMRRGAATRTTAGPGSCWQTATLPRSRPSKLKPAAGTSPCISSATRRTVGTRRRRGHPQAPRPDRQRRLQRLLGLPPAARTPAHPPGPLSARTPKTRPWPLPGRRMISSLQRSRTHRPSRVQFPPAVQRGFAVPFRCSLSRQRSRLLIGMVLVRGQSRGERWGGQCRSRLGDPVRQHSCRQPHYLGLARAAGKRAWQGAPPGRAQPPGLRPHSG